MGRDSAKGEPFLKKLIDAETEIDALAKRIAESRKTLQDAQSAYDGFLAKLVVD